MQNLFILKMKKSLYNLSFVSWFGAGEQKLQAINK
jgi:hypothetical protein